MYSEIHTALPHHFFVGRVYYSIHAHLCYILSYYQKRHILFSSIKYRDLFFHVRFTAVLTRVLYYSTYFYIFQVPNKIILFIFHTKFKPAKKHPRRKIGGDASLMCKKLYCVTVLGT